MEMINNQKKNKMINKKKAKLSREKIRCKMNNLNNKMTLENSDKCGSDVIIKIILTKKICFFFTIKQKSIE